MASGMVVCCLQQCFSPSVLRLYLAEFISTFLFVFATAGSARMLTPDSTSDASFVVATAVAQAFAVLIAADASGGDANPAVTFAFAIRGHTDCRADRRPLLRRAVARRRLRLPRRPHPLRRPGGDDVHGGRVVYTVPAACDPRDRAGGRRCTAETAAGSVAIGLVTGACAPATGSLTCASVKPARSVGPAVVSGLQEPGRVMGRPGSVGIA
ncbi:putative aquaporin TIP5-1 [Panicum miliaceum]|uniref:Aquaporin TIP5-1 n=1 Tax=Panicum miliaceum TaxID=4540 RepID=A0A3L6PKX2_PANMI|nr:putative aquaporin TIP5-1 [Panicum miliaceum]